LHPYLRLVVLAWLPGDLIELMRRLIPRDRQYEVATAIVLTAKGHG